jgi:hypothetical protein
MEELNPIFKICNLNADHLLHTPFVFFLFKNIYPKYYIQELIKYLVHCYKF